MVAPRAGPRRGSVQAGAALWRWAAVALVITVLAALAAAAIYAGVVERVAGLGFRNLRPIHVTFAMGWIFLGGYGGMALLLPDLTGRPLASPRLLRRAAMLVPLLGLAMLVGYLSDTFSGREYFAFWPPLSMGVVVLVGLCALTFARACWRLPRPFSPTLWMWTASFVLFFWAFGEAHLWMLPGFSDRITHDMGVQWKALGSFVGAWNMLLYGLLAATNPLAADTPQRGRDREIAMALFFVSLTNSMFNWGHHTYHLPQAALVHRLAFGVTMTEAIILVAYLHTWLRGLTRAGGARSIEVLLARGVQLWTLVMLAHALLISIPPVNALTHGTHVTVAHAMAATIGVNTGILVTVAAVVFRRAGVPSDRRRDALLRSSFWLTQAGGAGIFVALNLAGWARGAAYAEHGDAVATYYIARAHAAPWIAAFALSGLPLAAGLLGSAWWWMVGVQRLVAPAEILTASAIGD